METERPLSPGVGLPLRLPHPDGVHTVPDLRLHSPVISVVASTRLEDEEFWLALDETLPHTLELRVSLPVAEDSTRC